MPMQLFDLVRVDVARGSGPSWCYTRGAIKQCADTSRAPLQRAASAFAFPAEKATESRTAAHTACPSVPDVVAAQRTCGGCARVWRAAAAVDTAQTLDTNSLRHLLRAAPLLSVCDAALLDVCSVSDVRCMLRREPPFQPLCLRALCVDFVRDNFRTEQDEADSRNTAVFALVAELGAHAWLKQLVLCNAPLYKDVPAWDDEEDEADEQPPADNDVPATVVIDTVVDAALARGLESIRFVSCDLDPTFVPAVVRLVNGGTLKSLAIEQIQHLFNASGMALFADAVRASSTLTKLVMCGNIINHDVEHIPVLLGALTGHCSACTLRICDNCKSLECRTYALRAALGALVAANAPALTELDVSDLSLGDVTIRPLLDALAVNTHLRKLDVWGTAMSVEFTRDVLLPAVHANTGLRQLTAICQWREPRDDDRFARAAEAAVAERCTRFRT